LSLKWDVKRTWQEGTNHATDLISLVIIMTVAYQSVLRRKWAWRAARKVCHSSVLYPQTKWTEIVGLWFYRPSVCWRLLAARRQSLRNPMRPSPLVASRRRCSVLLYLSCFRHLRFLQLCHLITHRKIIY